VKHHQISATRAEHRALLLRTVLEALRSTGLPGGGLRNEVAAVDDRQAAAVLGYNYPDSEWYRDSYRMLAPGGEEAEGKSGDTEATRSFWKRFVPKF
jgi:hypothetical protein